MLGSPAPATGSKNNTLTVLITSIYLLIKAIKFLRETSIYLESNLAKTIVNRHFSYMNLYYGLPIVTILTFKGLLMLYLMSAGDAC